MQGPAVELTPVNVAVLLSVVYVIRLQTPLDM